MTWKPELPHEKHLERRIERARHFGRDRNTTSRQREHDDIGPIREVAKVLGELPSGVAAPMRNRKVNTKREFAGFTYGYNHPLFAQRVHDILTLVSYIRGDEHLFCIGTEKK